MDITGESKELSRATDDEVIEGIEEWDRFVIKLLVDEEAFSVPIDSHMFLTASAGISML